MLTAAARLLCCLANTDGHLRANLVAARAWGVQPRAAPHPRAVRARAVTGMNPRWEMPQFEDQSMQVEFEARQADAGLKRERDPDSADDTSVDASPYWPIASARTAP